MSVFTVRLEDDTCGVIESKAEIGEIVTVHLFDENDSKIAVTGILAEVFDDHGSRDAL